MKTHTLILPPAAGDVYVVLESMGFDYAMSDREQFLPGMTLTLVREVSAKREEWLCLTDLGLHHITFISYRVSDGYIQLLCKSSQKG